METPYLDEIEYQAFAAAVDELNACKTQDQVAALLRSEGIKGDRHACDTCPVANFLRKRLGPDVGLQVGYYSAWLLRYDHSREIPLEIPVRVFIRAFDRDDPSLEEFETLRPVISHD